MRAGLRRRVVLPRDPRGEATGRILRREAEAEQRGGAILELCDRGAFPVMGTVLRLRTLEPIEGHGPSILGVMRGLIALVTIAAYAQAYADTGLVVVGDDKPATIAAMREAIGGTVVADAVGDARTAAAEGAVPLAQLARFRAVRDEIEQGVRAYKNVKLELAQQRLVAARLDAEAALELPGMVVLYAEATLRLGITFAQLGRQEEAHDAIALALALDPDRPITALEFAPDTIALIDTVRGMTRPSRKLAITTEPSHAALVVDGKDAGFSPATLELATGSHVVIARAPLHHAVARAFSVGDKTPDLAIPLPPQDEELASGADIGTPDDAAQIVIDRTLELANLDDVVLIAMTERRGGPTLLVQRCAGQPARCTAVAELGYADRSGIAAAARSVWQSVRTADLRYPPNLFSDPRLIGNLEEAHCRLCRSPIVWAGVGIVAIGVTIAIVAAVSGSHPPPTVTVDPTSFTH